MTTISVNAIFTVLLVICMAYLSTQVVYQQQEIKNFRTKLQKVQNGRIHLRQNSESAHLIGRGNTKVRSRPPPGDVYRVTSWKKQHMSGNMSYDNNGHLTVKVDGVYFLYTQMYYYDGNNSYTGFSVYIDNKRVLKAIYSVIDLYKRYHTHYIGGVFKITKGQRIWVGTTITRLYYFNEFSSFFGAYMLHSLP